MITQVREDFKRGIGKTAWTKVGEDLVKRWKNNAGRNSGNS